jgi:hypothetical protein
VPKYKNAFRSPDFREETIIDENNTIIGAVRLKPSSILWKPKGGQKYFSVTLKEFTDWISDPSTKARKTKS